MQAFEDASGLKKLKIDAIDDEALSSFVLRGVHYNVSSVDLKSIPEHTGELEYIDIRSSYANFWMCRLYRRFPNKITDLRVTDRVEGPGFYLIHELDWSAANPKFRDLCKRLGDPYAELNVYPNPWS